LIREILFWTFFASSCAATLLTLVVPALKEKFGLFLLGFATFGYAWIVGAIRLAKPNSFWGRRFYAAEKMMRSRRRFPADV